MKAKLSLIFLFSTFSSILTFGQNQYLLKNFLTVENGLSHNEVVSIVQDKQGFMWLGTRGGLNRYDGYEFKVFNQIPGDSNSLVNPSIECLFVDSKGCIWIGTKSGGVSKYNPATGVFKNISTNYKQQSSIITDNRILTFYEDKLGRIWIGTWGSGLIIYDESDNSAKYYLGQNRINTIVETPGNRIFVGGINLTGVFEYSEEGDTFINQAPAVNNFTCFDMKYDSTRDVIWVIERNDSRLIKFNFRENTETAYKITNTSASEESDIHYLESLFIDNFSKIWVGTWGTGLYVFDPESETFERNLIYQQGRPTFNKDYDVIPAIFQDKDNAIWLGTNGGGACILSQNMGFNSVGYHPELNKGLTNTRIMTVLEDKAENLWIGTIGSGLVWSPDRENFYQVSNPLIEKSGYLVIKYLYEDKLGNVWAGTNDGTYIIDFNGGKPTMVRAEQRYSEFVFHTAVSVLDSHGMLWLGTLENGLLLYDKKTGYTLKKHLIKNDSSSGNLKNDRISYLFQDSKERVWIGTYDGLHIYNPIDTTVQVAEQFYKIEGEFTGNIITCLDEDENGNLWVGTPNGLNKLTEVAENEFRIEYYTEEIGLASNFVKGISHDNKGNVWLSTNIGISKYESNNKRFINFDETNGVLGKHFTEASVFKNKSGVIFFGGTQGLTYFKADEIVTRKESFKPVFTGLSVLNQNIEPVGNSTSKNILAKTISHSNEIELSYGQNNFEISFSALDYKSMGRNKYKYKLENHDENWIEIGTQRYVKFNNLKPGKYKLKVISANSHQVWNDDPAELIIKINPPFWRTNYALLFYILLVTGIVIVIRRNAMRQVHLRNSLEIETLQHEQDQKLNELKLRFFTNISHEFRTPLTLILAPLKEIIRKKEKYEMNDELFHKIGIAQNNSQRLMNMVNQLLEFRKVETDNMKLIASLENIEDFVMEICSPFYELAGINNIEFTTESELNTKEVWFDSDKLEIIINNLISNAFKFSQNDAIVKVILSENEGNVFLKVSDNGQGIPSNEIENIFDRYYRVNQQENSGGSGIGLALSKRLVELHKGTLSVSSEPSVHTEFSLSLLKGKEHLLPDEMIQKKKSTFLKKENPFSTIVPEKVESEKELEHCVLIVEDTLDVRTYLFSLLAPLYRVHSAADGEEAMKMAKKCKPDLILSDVIMPNMDGIELCRKIRSNPSSADIPFIFLTAKNDEQTQLLSAQIGANDIISKPFDPNFLLEKVASTLKRYKNLQLKFSKSVWLEPSNIEITSGDDAFLSKAILVVENNLQNDDFSANVLASELNKSYSSLYRKLKKLTGASISDFIRSIRIKRAAQLIADKEKTISEIAFEVGFNDLKYFRKVFQKEFDCSPSEYRKKV